MSESAAGGRVVIEVYLRSFPGWEALRRAVAAAAKVAVGEVRSAAEGGSPAVLLDAVARPFGFQATATLSLDRSRVGVSAIELARGLALASATDAAIPDAAAGARRWLLVRADGRSFSAEATPRTDRVLVLDERPEQLRPLEP